MNAERGSSFTGLLKVALDWAKIVGNIVLGLAMVAVFGVGVTKIALASTLLAVTFFDKAPDHPSVAAMELMKGLEFIFLAPLGLLTFRCLTKYVRASIFGVGEERLTAEHDVHRLKLLIGNLIAAFLLTDLVSKALRGFTPADLWPIGGEAMVLLAAILYAWSLPNPDAR